LQETRVPDEDLCLRQCVSIFVNFRAIIFRQWNGRSQPNPGKPARKKNLTRKVTQGHTFGITEKLTTDCISLYNNAGLISKVSEETDSENAENCRSRQSHCRMTPLPKNISVFYFTCNQSLRSHAKELIVTCHPYVLLPGISLSYSLETDQTVIISSKQLRQPSSQVLKTKHHPSDLDSAACS